MRLFRLSALLATMLFICASAVSAGSTKVPQAKAAFDAGLRNKETNRIRQAMACFSMAIGSDKNFADAYGWRGMCYYEMDQLDESLQDEDKAISLDPHFDLAYHVRSDVYVARRDLHQALKDMNQACAFGPKDAGNFYSRAKVHEMLGDKQKAVQDYLHCMALDKANGFGCFRLANLEQGMGNYQLAIDYYTRNLKLRDPEHLEATYNNRATCYDKLGKHDLAKLDRQKAKGITEGTWSLYLRPLK